MLYFTNEARENALNEIARLYVMLAETKPTEQWYLQDIQSVMMYLEAMRNQLLREMREETENRQDYENSTPIFGVNRYYPNTKVIDKTDWFFKREQADFATTQGDSSKTVITARYHEGDDIRMPYITVSNGEHLK